MSYTRKLILLLLVLVVSACGGGGSSTSGDGTGAGNDGGNAGNNSDNSDDSDNSDNSDNSSDDGDDGALTGVFVDSPVGGIGYRTESRSGETTANGEFTYLAGESVTFFLGDVDLPATAADRRITPLDVFQSDSFGDQRVLNLARLLQSLDADGNPENGIELTDAAHSAATGTDIDFDVSTGVFEANPHVVNLVSNGGGAGVLVPVEQAAAHLQQLSLVGSWIIPGGAPHLAVTFVADERYMIAEIDEPDDAGQPGVEYGNYAWDPVTGEISVDTSTDTNGEWGLSHPQPDLKLLREGGELVLSETVDGTLEKTALTRVAETSNPIVGGWYTADSDGIAVLVFTDTNNYSIAEVGPPTVAGFTGPEAGSFTWTSATGEFFPVADEDFNGDWGFSHEPGEKTLTVNGDVLTISFSGGGGGTFRRITHSAPGLEGGWYRYSRDVVFMSDRTYMISEGNDVANAGLEYGEYSWDRASGALSIEVVEDTNGERGLSHVTSPLTVWRGGDEIRFIDPPASLLDDTVVTDGVFVSARNEAAMQPAVTGSWEYKAGETVVVLTLKGGSYTWAEVGPATPGGASGPEYGSYSWNSSTHVFTPSVDPLLDFNGDWGFSGEEGETTVNVSGDRLTLEFAGSGEIVFDRVQ